jgi:hypothetical protein
MVVGVCQDPGMDDGARDTRTAVVVFWRAAAVTAALAVVFVVIDRTQSEGACDRADGAAAALTLTIALAVLGLPIVLVMALRRFREARPATLLGWTLGLVPAVALLIVAVMYVRSVSPDCSY